MNMFVKPKQPGAIVRFPGDPRRTLAEAGEEVPRTPYWIRRLNDGSIVETKPAAPKTKEVGK